MSFSSHKYLENVWLRGREGCNSNSFRTDKIARVGTHVPSSKALKVDSEHMQLSRQAASKNSELMVTLLHFLPLLPIPWAPK